MERLSLPQNTLVRHLLVAALGMAVVIMALTAVSDFRRFQLAEMACLAIAAGGLTVLTGLNGQLSLGHGALMAVGTYTTALLLPDRDASTPLVVVVLLSVGAATLVGALVGVAAARLHGPYLAGATLALAVAVPGLALHFSETLGGEQGIRVVAPPPPVWAEDATYFLTASDLTPRGWIAFLAWSTLVLSFLLLANLSRSRVGRRWQAVRDDPVAAELAGIVVGRSRVSAFTVSAAAAGAAGSMLALVVRLAAPGSFTLALSLTLIAAVVLGGLGSLTGALLGAALLTFLPQFVTQVGRDAGLDDVRAAELAPLVYGVVMVLVILLAPGGLFGVIRGVSTRRRARRALAARSAETTDDSTSSSDNPSDPTDPTADHRTATTTQGAPR